MSTFMLLLGIGASVIVLLFVALAAYLENK